MKSQEVLRRVLLIANYGFFGFCGIIFIVSWLLDLDTVGLVVMVILVSLVFGFAYGLQKLINWIFQPPEARTTKDTMTTRPPPPPTVFESEEPPPPPPTVFESEEPDLPEEEEVPTPSGTRFFNWVVPAAGVISVVISMVNGALALCLLFLWAMGSPVTGGTGYTPVREMDFICAVALVGVIFGLIDLCSGDGPRSQMRLAVVTVLGCLPNSFVFLVGFLIRFGSIG